MKNMNRVFLWIAAMAVSILPSCVKTDGIRDELDGLRDRVSALESRVGEVNSSIEALRRLMDESTVIVGVKAVAGGYVIEFSDGTECRVIEGEKLDTLVPVLGIDEEGFWTVSLDGGATSERIADSEGNPLSAWPVFGDEHRPSDGAVTPVLRVSAEGMWEISRDGGATYEPLLQNGEPVNALGDNAVVSYSTYFKSVEYDEKGGLLRVVLVSGEELVLPVCDDFGLEIVAGDNEKFFLGETRSFEVVQTNVAEAVLRAPEGWHAVLGEDELTVTAPSRAAAEDTFTLSVVVTSDKGYLKMANLKMTLLNEQQDADACAAWRNFKAGSEDNVLLDYSYAGYRHGESAPAEVSALGYKVYDVTDYGADPSGKTSSRGALQKLLEELKLSGKTSSGSNQANADARAVIYFPEGRYILHNEEDDTNGTSEEIFIRGGNFVLKGAGRGKSVLVMDSPNLPNDPSQMWSSPVMINIKHNSGLSELTEVTGNAARGTFSVEVASAAGIAVGDRVCLKLSDNSPELVAQELAPHTVEGNMEDIKTVTVEDYHQVRSVEGNVVTFVEPIMHAVESRWKWTICKYPHYENVGVEDLTFEGHSKENFKHHGSWQDDGAYKPLQIMRVTDSWIRRVDFVNVSEAVSIVACANCSAYDIEISGNRGHSAVRSQSSSRIFIGKVYDHSSGSNVVPPQANAGTSDNAGQYHASGVSNTALGTVLWNNTWGEDAMFESHSKQPRATLVDRCTGGFVQWRFGGDDTNVPNHLSDLTIWNLNALSAKHDFGGTPFKWWLSEDKWWKTMPPIVVGMHGASVTFDESPEQIKYIESNGTPVKPLSLYEAQLQERLGYVPAWLNSLR